MPRISAPSSSRPEFYDRNPLLQLLDFGGTAGPHADTQRSAYTVPTGKKALINGVNAGLYLRTVASTSGTKEARASVTPDGGSRSRVIQAKIESQLNTAGDFSTTVIGAAGIILEADEFTTETNDNGTGGTLTFNLFATLTEFDA